MNSDQDRKHSGKPETILSKEVGDAHPAKPEPIFGQKPRQRFAMRFGNPVGLPVYETVSYFFENTAQAIEYHEGGAKLARYGRYDNPSWEYTETELASLEGCETALLFSSGMNAITTTLFTFCSQGDHIIYTKNCYRNICRFCKEIMPLYGIQADGISTINEDFIERLKDTLKDNTRVVFIEAPSNPHMCMIDFNGLKEVLAKRDDIITIVDSTFATPINFQPILYGVNLVIHSCTKYLSGQGDFMTGSVAGNRDLIEQIRQFRNILGGITTGNNASLLFRSLKTLKVRMAYYNDAGEKMAKFLENHSRVRKVYYLGLPSHPHYKLGQLYMNGFGGVVSYEVDGTREQVSKFIDSLHIPFISTNFGTYCTLIEQYGLFTLYHVDQTEKAKMGVSDQLVRMSLGFEHIDELIEDIDQALKKL